MIAEVLPWTVGVVASGLAALTFWKRKNGNGEAMFRFKPEDAARFPFKVQPVEVKWPPELAALLTHITERLEAAIERVGHPLAEKPIEPVWAAQIVQDLERIHDRMSEPATAMLPPELTAGLERVTDRLEALLQMPPPDLEPVVERLENLVASMPEPDQRPELEAELVRQLAELPQRVGRSVSDAVAERRPPAKNLAPPEKKNNPPEPPKRAPRSLPPLNPQEQPNVPSIPAPYVPGAVDVPAGQVWSLLYLIQKQLSPNCPGTSASFTISAEGGTVYVGGASAIGGPLSATNYAYKLEDGDPPVRYQSSYPGGSTPVGELQVLATGGATLHVEVQS